MPHSRLCAGAATAALIVSAPAAADFVVPDGQNYPWVRGSTPGTTYAQWEIFALPGGPNLPDAGVFVGGALPPGAPPWNAFDASGQAFVTGSGNIYSFAAPLTVHVDIPNFDRGPAAATTVILQVRTQGAEILPGSVTIGGLAPTQSIELHREPAGGPGGYLVDTLHRFELAGNSSAYEVRFDADGPSMSLDRIAIDTFAAAPPACYANCDESTVGPVLNVADFTCFLQRFAAGAPYANCDGSTAAPALNVADFTCFLQRFAAGCV